MANVQYKGATAVGKAFTKSDCEAWAIFEGRNLRFKGTGDQSLKERLTSLKEGSYDCVYTLKMYDTENVRSIKDKTEFEESFNFRLYSDDQGSEDVSPYAEKKTAYVGAVQQLAEEIRLDREQRARDLLEIHKEEPGDRLGIVGELMQSPLGPVISNILQSWFAPGAAAMANSMGAIGNIPAPPQKMVGSNNATLSEVIDGLRAHDPLIEKHLKKLLDIAINDNGSFLFLIKTLDSM